jgi:hypothetical protein
MRYVLLLCAVLCGACEYNYYGEVADGGEDMPQNIFKRDAKLQGNAILSLTGGPPAPAAGQPWPDVMNVATERAGAQTLIDLETADGMPHVVTVTMGLVGPLPTFGFDTFADMFDLVAILDIGIGGIMIQSEVDVLDGFSFSLACSRLQIHVAYRLFPGGLLVVPAPIPTIKVGV